MILNAADNIMLGDTEVQKVYCGDELVWERRKIPPQYTELTEIEVSVNTYPNKVKGFNSTFCPAQGAAVGYEARIKRVMQGSSYTLLGNRCAEPFKNTDVNPPIYYYRSYFYVTFGGNGLVSFVQYQTLNTIDRMQTNSVHAYDTWYTVSGKIEPTVHAGKVDDTTYGENFTKNAPITARDIWVLSNGDINNRESSQVNYHSQGNFVVGYIKLFENGGLVRHFVPVQRVSDGENGFWDYITKRFYLPYQTNV